MTDAHLAAIDAGQWPRVAQLPVQRFAGVRARRAEAEFAKACDLAGLELDSKDPDLTVHFDALFSRIAAGGWVGLAEGYMAGEWTTPDTNRLVKVLTRLIAVGYHPKTAPVPVSPDDGGQLPPELVRLYAGDGISHQGGIFSTGVPTTMRDAVPSFAPGPKTHFVDFTTLGSPTAVDREDLGYAQLRAADWLADAARVGAGSHVLVYPGSGVQAAVRAAERRAVVDVLTADPAAKAACAEFLVLEGASDNIHVQLIDSPIPSPKQWRGRYDAVVSVNAWEHFDSHQRTTYLGAVDRMLAPEGRAVIQAGVATDSLSNAARSALMALRAYVWPALELSTAMDFNRAVDKTTNLRVIAQVHAGAHQLESLRQQRSFFAGRLREAAAAGFDPVFRRLWIYQFALREALLGLSMVDEVHFTLVRRNRGGRR